MSKKLDALYEQYQEHKVEIEKQQEANAFLEIRLADKQNVVLEKMKNDLQGFLKYFKDVDIRKKLFLENVELSFYRSSYGDSPKLIVDFWGDNVLVKCNPSGYGSRPVIYDLNNDNWGWYADECKKFLAENWNDIAVVIEEEIFKALSKAINNETMSTVQTRAKLLNSIDKVNENIDTDTRKDVVLYNAISLLIDETFEQYEDKEKWFNMLQNELGVSAAELESIGIKVTADGGLDMLNDVGSVDKMIKNATARSESSRDGKAVELELGKD